MLSPITGVRVFSKYPPDHIRVRIFRWIRIRAERGGEFRILRNCERRGGCGCWRGKTENNTRRTKCSRVYALHGNSHSIPNGDRRLCRLARNATVKEATPKQHERRSNGASHRETANSLRRNTTNAFALRLVGGSIVQVIPPLRCHHGGDGVNQSTRCVVQPIARPHCRRNRFGLFRHAGPC